MPFQLSPGVNVTEVDLTTVIPSVATTEAAIGGVFRWGPVEKALLVNNENELVEKFGKPTNLNAETFFTAANYLAYSDSLYVSRAFESFVAGESGADALNISLGTTFTYEFGTDNDLEFGTLGEGITQAQFDAIEAAITAGRTVSVTATYGEGETLNATILSINTDVGETTLVFARTNVAIAALSGSTFSSTVVSSPAIAGSNGTGSLNAIANTNSADLALQVVKNEDHYEIASLNFDDDVQFVAKYPGELGNSLKISVCDSANAFSSEIAFNFDGVVNEEVVAFTVGSNTATVTFYTSGSGTATNTEAAADSVIADLSVGDIIRAGNSTIGYSDLTITAIGAVSVNVTTSAASFEISFDDRYTLNQNFRGSSISRSWGYNGVVDVAPGQSPYQLANGNTAANDELHLVVVDEDGKFSGVPGTILEVFQGLSRATDAKNEDGGTNYYKEVINQSSKYVWFANDIPGASSATSDALASSTNTLPYDKSFVGGQDTRDESSIPFADVARSYDLYQSAEDIDVSLVLTGKSIGGSTTVSGRTVTGSQLANYLIDNIAERRKDCVVFCSPEKADVVNNAVGDEEQDVVDFRNALRSTSYAVLDCNYKYQYDKYNDVYRWVPMNGDVAGLCAYTDDTRDPWWSPAGFNRGQIKNVIKLAWNPKKAERDLLYKNGVNPVVTFTGQGTVLYGDKTLLARPSAFDRINVRRLFIVLEKAIATASQSTLFEFNDAFTRAAFVNLVTPFLRDVQGRRGITDFVVICDETNNTGEVIDRNEFVGDIYIKPARSINFIQLNFVAVRTGVEFSEVIGNF